MIIFYFFKNFFYKYVVILSALYFVLINSCGEDNTLSASAEYIAGTVTFVDNNFLPSSDGYYAISLFSNQSNPFCFHPIRSDTLHVNAPNTSYYYKMSNIESGYYYIGVSWIPYSGGNAYYVFGTYGCDTASRQVCMNYSLVEYPSYAGTGNVSFLCWTRNNYINYGCDD